MITPPLTLFRRRETHRLIPSRFPPVGILDQIASPEDLEAIIELETWTNARISAELGILSTIPKSEWVIGRPNATVIMAAFCHPRPTGGRFNGSSRGAWYAALQFKAAQAEVIYHKTKELEEIGVLDTRIQFREYLSNFNAEFHDIRAKLPVFDPYHDPNSYAASQELAARLLQQGSNGILYRCVRYPGGECIACFRPPLIANVRQGAHFEFSWTGTPVPVVRRLAYPD
jgi:hypothetical protein